MPQTQNPSRFLLTFGEKISNTMDSPICYKKAQITYCFEFEKKNCFYYLIFSEKSSKTVFYCKKASSWEKISFYYIHKYLSLLSIIKQDNFVNFNLISNKNACFKVFNSKSKSA